jgi:hypothetical protein
MAYSGLKTICLHGGHLLKWLKLHEVPDLISDLRLGDQVPVDDPVETRASEGPVLKNRDFVSTVTAVGDHGMFFLR